MKKILCNLVLCVAALVSFGYADAKKPLVMATNAQFPPFEYREGNDFKGIDIDLAVEIAERLNRPLEIVDMEFDAVVLSLSSKKADIAICGLTVNPKRARVIDFSTPYYSAAQMILVRNGDQTFASVKTPEEAVKKINELGKVKIGVSLGTTGAFYAAGDKDWGFEGFKKADIKSFDSGALAVAALINKQVDLVIFDEMPAGILAKVHAGVEVLPVKLTQEDYAVGVQKGNPELLKAVNKVLDEIKKDGTFDKIVANHLLKEE